MLEHEYIEHVNGVCYRDPVTNIPYASYSSRMRATRKLIKLIVKHKVKLRMISRHPIEAVIFLRAEKDENDVAEDVPFVDMPRDVERSEKVLIAYNNLLLKTYIDIDDEFMTSAELDKMKKWEIRNMSSTALIYQRSVFIGSLVMRTGVTAAEYMERGGTVARNSCGSTLS